MELPQNRSGGPSGGSMRQHEDEAFREGTDTGHPFSETLFCVYVSPPLFLGHCVLYNIIITMERVLT